MRPEQTWSRCWRGCPWASLGLVALLLAIVVAQPAGASSQPLPASGMPERLVVPSIGVDADVAALALTDELLMPVPQTASLVAWYTFSAQAGAPGNAVLAGHRDWQGRRGVFFALGRVQAGDEVWLQDGRGTWYLYTVVWSASLPDDGAPIDELVGPTGRPSVTLITCSGVFDRPSARYLERQVVRAELVAVVGSPGEDARST